MNDKVTFQELVDAIAEQSGKPKQFTHDFIKDLVSIIQESLEKDGNINIAGLGKFELKKIEEREGFNPQTEEKITIPAHNKIDFTPYKDLRELVNAPYSHMEPEIIEEDSTDDSEDQDEPGGNAAAGAEDLDEKSEKKAPWEEDMESELDVDEEDPFGLNAKRTGRPSFSFEEDTDDGDDDDKEGEGDDEDVVEFTPGLETETDDETEEEEIPETDDTSGEATPSVPEEVEEDEAEDVVEAEDETTASIPAADDIDEESEEWEEPGKPEQPIREEQVETKSKFTPKSTLSFRDRRHRKRDAGGGSTFWIIAAAFIILLLAIGVWYFMGAQQGSSPDSMDTQAVQTESPTDEQQESTQTAESQQEQQQEQEEQEADQSTSDVNQQPTSGQQQADPGQQSTQPDDPPPVETITVARGQTLWGLADNHYENPYLWPWIYDTNKASIDNPDIIVIGQSLDIPMRRGSNDSLSENDSLQVALAYIETYKWYKENNLENAKFYLFAAKKYHSRVFEYTDEEFDEADLAFANRAQ